ncbi:MlaD family protein [Thioclava sp. A2]|uniref:PqiB family protein n=1 Tax=Thioclava sp. FCG-A2 TaxID=3080562 RepID=UPI0029557D8D|nr:MlaD family protein [Thioclava sp. A2]MDV7270641.1 MlaD family protein [Thioclava sp. A2]
MSDPIEPAELVTSPARSPMQSRLSLIWLVPLLALAVTLGVAWRSYSDRGALVEIDFADATGIKPGETPLKFREVEVGKVEKVGFSDDLKSVRVSVRIDKDIAPFVDEDAQFWLVRPQVSAQGISRLDTVLSGIFIEGFWDNQQNGSATLYKGLDKAPIAPDLSKGKWIELLAPDGGGLAEGAPVIYRGLAVGRLRNLRLNEGGAGVIVDAFIDKPYDARISSNTRFWDTSGISVSLGPSGANLDVRSLASLVQGGIEFETFATGGAPIENGHGFRLFESADKARQSIFGNDLENPARFVLLFDDAIKGIELGTKVMFRGIEAGEVTEISVRVETDSVGNPAPKQQVAIALAPVKLGLDSETGPEVVAEFLANEVELGLRARIAAAGILGTTRVIELTDVENLPPAKMNLDRKPFPSIPTAPVDESALASSAEGVFNRIQALPIEELMNSAIRTMDAISDVASDEQTRAIPAELKELLAGLRTMTDELNAQGAAAKTGEALDLVSSAAQSVLTEIEGLGDMLKSADDAAQAVAAMPLGDIGKQIDGLLGDIRTMLGSKDAERLPRALSDTLEESAALLAELRAGGAADKLNGTLEAAQSAATAVSGATDRLPELTRKLETLVSRAEQLVSAYGERSSFNNEIVSTIRELRNATSAFGSLARMIERNPRAFILGR